MDLPAELRQTVYRHVFPKDTISEAKTLKHLPRQVGVFSFSNKLLDRGVQTNIFVHRATNIDLLRVSKQIYKEVAPILYESHTFEFPNDSVMKKFLRLVGPMTANITQIVIKASSWPMNSKALRKLSGASALRSVVVEHGILCGLGAATLGRMPVIDYAAELFEIFLRPFISLGTQGVQVRGGASWKSCEWNGEDAAYTPTTDINAPGNKLPVDTSVDRLWRSIARNSRRVFVRRWL